MIERIPAGDRATWLELRKQDVTASSAAALLGVHPFISAFELWALKTGRITEDPEESGPLRRGRLLEPVAVQLLREEKRQWDIRHNTGAKQVYFRDPAIRIGATPDVIAMDPDRPGFGVVQVKTVEPGIFRQKWRNEAGEIEPPIWIVIQALIEAKLTGSSWAAVAPLVVGFGVEMPIIDIPIHEGVYERICAEVQAFWQRIADGVEPSPDYGRDGALLARLLIQDNGQEIDLSADNMLPALLDERETLKGQIKAHETRCDTIDAEIRAKVGEAQVGRLPGWKVSLKTQHTQEYTVRARTTRPIRVTRTKGEAA